MIINLDETNNIFSVEPLLNKYNSFDEILVEDVAIEKNEDNKILNVKINSESQCKNYFTNFKRIMLSKPELAYNYLDKEYREKRFQNNYNNFIYYRTQMLNNAKFDTEICVSS